MKRAILSVVMSICTIAAFSQAENNNLESKYKFGFNLGTNYSILQADELFPSDAEIYNGVGFKVGVIMDYLLTKNLSISPKTEISFNKSQIEKANNDNTRTTYQVLPTTIEIMTHLVYKIGNGKNKPYLLAGPNLKIPLKTKTKKSTQLESSSTFAIDFGIGLEHKFKYFFFAPELRYSMGLSNINENPIFPLINFHNVSLVFNFE